jgi:hypothetical protein
MREPETRWLLWTIAGCCLLVVLAPVIISARPAPVLSVALLGGTAAVMIGIGAAVVRIVLTHGRPLGDRDPALDANSPLLRPGNRLGLLLAIGMILFSIAGLAFAVYWYPRGHPFIPEMTPEEYVLPGLLLLPFLLALGVYWLVVQLWWARVVHQVRRASSSADD